MFEMKHEPLLPLAAFLSRMSRSFGATLLIVSVSLLIGSAGYHHFGEMSWIDALLNAAMILTGMGPVDAMTTTGGKLFATPFLRPVIVQRFITWLPGPLHPSGTCEATGAVTEPRRPPSS